ncbi:hypothetical protein BU16DRAFT_568458 [Lophium mytilinum]|uniref:Uncharacterized protein n=1 Tax=Lophium mytilinum TaxID=390894 RepID=A0A6A6Q8M9_9PEZI|nr:hypothetical protein BU16DRAFT_568458 [Lophium mytilinum]
MAREYGNIPVLGNKTSVPARQGGADFEVDTKEPLQARLRSEHHSSRTSAIVDSSTAGRRVNIPHIALSCSSASRARQCLGFQQGPMGKLLVLIICNSSYDDCKQKVRMSYTYNDEDILSDRLGMVSALWPRCASKVDRSTFLTGSYKTGDAFYTMRPAPELSLKSNFHFSC